jgi:hypothetical protein
MSQVSIGADEQIVVLFFMLCVLNAHAVDTRKTVRLLRVEDYPELPSEVAVVLRGHQCTIPQPNPLAATPN